MRVGMIGTGMLGGAIALRLLQCGHSVCAYNRTREKAAPLEQAGASIASSAADAAAVSEVVITCVTDGEALRTVALGSGGIAEGARGKLVVADMSTVLPGDLRGVASKLRDSGVATVGAPVMGGPDAAAAGSLVIMADGDEADLEFCRGALADLGSITHLGGHGTAHTVKLAMNLQIASLASSISEGIALVRAAGADPEAFLGVLNSTYFATGMSRKKAPRMARGEYPPTFLLRNLAKDLRLAAELAESSGAALPVSSQIRRTYDDAVEAGLGDLDYTGILDHVEGSRGSP